MIFPYSTLWRWERGMTTSYNMSVVQRLCEHYSLDARDIWELILRDTARRLAGQRVATPDLSFRKRGPIPSTPRTRKLHARAR